LYTSRARLKTLLIEKLAVSGQAIITDIIENYPGFPEGIKGPDLIKNFKRQAESFGLEFAIGEVRNISVYPENSKLWQVEVEDKIYNSLAVIIAVGARYRELDVPGEKKFRGRGVSYCATCDGPFFRNKEIVIVGGGDTAVEEALFLTKFAKKVTLVHRRDRLRATKVLQERALSNKRIEFVWDSVVNEVLGEDKVGAVKVKNVKTEKETEISTDGVFVSIGSIPNTNFLKEMIKLDEKGYIITDENMETSKEGTFACGDCRKKILRQVVTACGDGATAAFSAQKYIEEKGRLNGN